MTDFIQLSLLIIVTFVAFAFALTVLSFAVLVIVYLAALLIECVRRFFANLHHRRKGHED